MVYKIQINDRQIVRKDSDTILQVCSQENIQVPKFCYHELLSIAGNCRMCLVQVNNSNKPVVSCATNLMDQMLIYTTNSFIQKVREDVLEFLLINHPLDCPICDQAGECDLQDQTLFFGSDRGRFKEVKRSVIDKQFGPFIKTIMTRCIHCTRCVRFSNEIAGISYLGTTGRGVNTEITNYIHDLEMQSVLSGNLIDICPVGALTSKPYAFVGRPWELTKTESIDIFDTVGSNIRIDSRGSDILRILPKLNEEINEEWITDKVRFSYDGLKIQRLVIPSFKKKKWSLNSSFFEFVSISWIDSFNYIKNYLGISKLLYKKKISFGYGNLLDLESLLSLKYYTLFFKMYNLKSENNYKIDIPYFYLFNSNYNSLRNYNLYFLIGSNLELEAPILNLKIRKNLQEIDSTLYYLGYNYNLNYKFNHIGFNTLNLKKILQGAHSICFFFKLRNKNKLSLINLDRFNSVTDTFYKYFIKYSNVGFISTVVSSLMGKDIGFQNSYLDNNNYKGCENSYNLFYNISDNRSLNIYSKYKIYQGTHGFDFLKNYDLLLPTNTFTEGNGFFINMEGKLQNSRKVVPSPGQSKSNFEILSSLYYFMTGVQFNFKITYPIFYLNKINSLILNLFSNVNFICGLNNYNILSNKTSYYNDNEISHYSLILNKKKNNFITNF